MGYDGLAFRSAEPLPEQQLTRLRIHQGDGEVAFLANITSCLAAGDEFIIEAKPFGLDGKPLQQWLKLWRHVSQGADAA